MGLMYRTLLSYVVPQLVVREFSDLNGAIEVWLFGGRYTLQVGGLSQSGGPVAHLWRRAMSLVANTYFSCWKPERILLFGLAGGTIIHTIHARWPNALVQAVEYDPVIVKMGRQYFTYDMHAVTVDIADARSWLSEEHHERYDLIIFDVFDGSDVPSWIRDSSYLSAAGELLDDQGVMLINRGIFERADLKVFTKVLQEHFAHVRTFRLGFNRVFAAMTVCP